MDTTALSSVLTDLARVERPFGQRSPYRCPVCESVDVAHERTVTTTRYQNPQRTYRTDRTVVRCTACGEDAIYAESESLR